MTSESKTSQKSDERYIDAAERRVIIPASEMTIHRWMHDPRVDFPKPVKLSPGGKNYWWLPEIRDWQARRAALSTKRHVPSRGARPAPDDACAD